MRNNLFRLAGVALLIVMALCQMSTVVYAAGEIALNLKQDVSQADLNYSEPVSAAKKACLWETDGWEAWSGPHLQP